METVPRPSADTPDVSAQQVIRRVSGRYAYVLVAVAGLVVMDQAILQPMLIHMNAFAPAINLAGRQRMLSQQITKAALVLDGTRDDAQRQVRHEELETALARWTSEHDALIHGDPASGIVPIHTAALDTEWATLEPHYRAMVAAAHTVIDSPDGPPVSPAAVAAVDALVKHEARLLPIMDRIVGLMEQEAAAVVGRVRGAAIAIAVLVVALLVGLGWYVVRPATQTIRSQVDGLEARVALRTSELQTAVSSLEQEVHERQAAESRNQKLSAQLSHAARVSTMGHLTAGLAHEINQPLAAITNSLEACDILLDDGTASGVLDRVRELAGDAKRSALRAGQIVKRMRSYVRPGDPVCEAVRVSGLISDVVELCRAEIADARTEVLLTLAATDDVVIADPIQIQQVLVNLVQNALQAMVSHDSETRHLAIRTSHHDGQIRIDVVDTGPGFGLINTEVAFAPFRSTKADGLGIGLSICRSIVEDHQGRIEIESSADHGGTVSLTLPLASSLAIAPPLPLTAPHDTRSQPHTDCLCR